jgi:hypothetical protein
MHGSVDELPENRRTAAEPYRSVPFFVIVTWESHQDDWPRTFRDF